MPFKNDRRGAFFGSFLGHARNEHKINLFEVGLCPYTPVHSFLYKKERNQEKVSPMKSSGRLFVTPLGS